MCREPVRVLSVLEAGKSCEEICMLKRSSSSCPICSHLGEQKKAAWGFPGSVVVKNPPANAGDVASIPGLGVPHTWQSN